MRVIRFWMGMLTILLASSTWANEASVAARLKELGGQVILTDGHISRVEFRNCSRLGITEFRQLGELKQLKSLTLHGDCHGLNDETLPLLAGLHQLEELSTDGVRLTDAGLENFKPLVNLRTLKFFHISFKLPGFTGKGFVHLKSLPKLERLTIAGTTFNDEGMQAIGELTQLKEFRTWHTFQTQAGNVHLTKLTQLRALHLGQRLRNYSGQPNPPSHDDSTLATIAQIPSLETLSLDEMRLTHAALKTLQALPKLNKLVVQRTDIAPDEIEKLRADLPRVTIEFKPLNDQERLALERLLKS